VEVTRLLPDIPLCVPESEAEVYAEHNDNELIVHPDSINGISAKRQWLYDEFCDIFMTDDDMFGMRNQMVAAGEPAQVRDPETIRALIYRLFDMAEQIGVYLCGFSNFAHPAASRPQRPFKLTGWVVGAAMGLRAGSKLKFPRYRYLFTDDLWIGGLNAYHHRSCLLDERYALIEKPTWTLTGGAQGDRTWDKIRKSNEVMFKAFGDAISLKEGEGPKLAPRKHSQQIALSIPW